MTTLFLLSGSPHHKAAPGPFLSAWPWHPWLLLALLLPLGLYLTGWLRLQRAGQHSSPLPVWRLWCFLGALGAISLALLSPIAVYSEVLFSMHMVQHLLLLVIGPPLVLLGAPMLPLLWGLPSRLRRRLGRQLAPGKLLGRIGRTLAHPLVAVSAYVVTVAVWHVPRFYDAAQGRTFTHDLEHVMFFSVAVLYWWPMIYPGGGRRQLSYLRAVPYLLPPFLEGMLIGALITLSGAPLYETYIEAPEVWGLNTLSDQQLGGLIMWVPGGLLFLIPLFSLLYLGLVRSGRSDQPVSPASAR